MCKIFSKNILLFMLLLILAAQGRVVHAQSGCDPATGQQCDATPAPTCGLPGQPPCSGGGGSASDPEPKPKPTKTSPPPIRTFTPTATATPTNTLTPNPTATSTIQPATLPPRPTEPSLTPTEVGANPYARQQSTAIPYTWTIYPTRFGGLGNSSRLLFGILGALIVIGIVWFVRARYFADGSVRKNASEQPVEISTNTPSGELIRAIRYRDTVRLWIQEGWNKGNFDVVERIFDPNFHLKDFSNPDAQPYIGHVRLKRYVLRFRKAFPDLRMTDDDIFVAGSQVVWRFVGTGTHQGRFLGLYPSGKPFKVKGVAIFEFSGDKLQECGSYWNSFSLVHQIAGDLNSQEIISAMQKFKY